MTLTDAWKELGVDPGADADTVRRAYLRLIKTRKPESDPVGFQRAREAFEIARVGGEIESLASGSARRHAPVFTGGPAPSFATPPGTGPFDAPPAAREPEASPEPDAPRTPDRAAPEPAPAERPQADIIFDGFSTAWHSIPPSADQHRRLEIAREAVAVLPDDPRAHWLLVTTLSRLGPDAALADALRAGWRHGWPEFLEALLVRLPARATREEIDAGFALAEPASRLAAAAATAGWDAPRAAELVIELCDDATEADLDVDQRGDRVRELPVGRILDVILALHAVGALQEAVDAQGALRECLQETGLELALVRGPLGGVWTLAEEIGNLPRNFPQRLRTAFAIATRSGDLSSAILDARLAIEDSRDNISGWAATIAASAPNVAAILRTALAKEAAAETRRTGFQVSRLSYLLIPLALAIVRMCVQSASHSSYTSTAPPIVSVSPSRAYSRPAALNFGSDLDRITEASTELCGADGSRRGQLVCADVDALVTALHEHDCPAVKARLTAVKRVLQNGPQVSAEARFLNRVVITRWQMCGAAQQADTEAEDP